MTDKAGHDGRAPRCATDLEWSARRTAALAVAGCAGRRRDSGRLHGRAAGHPGRPPSTSTAAHRAARAPRSRRRRSPSTPSSQPDADLDRADYPAGSGAPVHIKLFGGDGQTFGVAMPMIAYLSAKITDARGFDLATTVTVNGQPAGGAWYFEDSALISGYPIEAHYRPQNYWPAHAVDPADAEHAGRQRRGRAGLRRQPDRVVDDRAGRHPRGRRRHRAADGDSDGALYGTFPVSLGAPKTPTLLGTKVIMEFDRNERMIGPGYNEIVPYSMRVTNSGEFLHAAAWNVANIGKRSTSNGCTNLLPADAAKLFGYLQIGDPVTYTNVAGAVQPVWDGYGDWNVPWATWLAGGVVAATAA